MTEQPTLIGPGQPCVHCGEGYGLHEVNCSAQKKNDAENKREERVCLHVQWDSCPACYTKWLQEADAALLVERQTRIKAETERDIATAQWVAAENRIKELENEVLQLREHT